MGGMNRQLKSLLMKFQICRDLRDGRVVRRSRESGVDPLFLDYRGRSVPRYGHGQPPHPELLELLSVNRERYANTLRTFLSFRAVLQEIPVHPPADPAMPYWLN